MKKTYTRKERKALMAMYSEMGKEILYLDILKLYRSLLMKRGGFKDEGDQMHSFYYSLDFPNEPVIFPEREPFGKGDMVRRYLQRHNHDRHRDNAACVLGHSSRVNINNYQLAEVMDMLSKEIGYQVHSSYHDSMVYYRPEQDTSWIFLRIIISKPIASDITSIFTV